MNTIIEIKNATKRFKDKTIFENVSLNIEKGKSYGFIGYNGCGKSVFFKTICGFSRLTDGEVICNGNIIGKDTDFIQNAGVVIETPEFINDYSGFKNLKLLAQVQNKIGDKEILEILEKVGLSKDKDKKVRKYSLGMKQKLRLAQAFMERPKILILDEPMNGLDKTSVHTIRSILTEFVKDGGALLMTSHNAEDIQVCCQIIYEFDNGSILLKSNAD